MWRFMEGVQNPNKKMKVDVDKHQRDSEYDRRRVRTFQNSWKTGRPWLIFNKPKNVMTCSFCTDLAAARNENNSSAFAGCDNFRIETLRAHEMSDFHKRSNSVNDAKSSKSGTTPAEKIMQNLNSAQVNKMSILFCNDLFLMYTHLLLVRHCRLFTDYFF